MIDWPLPVPVGQDQHDFLQHAREDTFSKKNEPHFCELLHQELADFGGVVHGEQFSRQHEAEAAAGLEEQRGMYGKGCP